MVDINTTYTFQKGFGTGINYDFVETENGIIKHSGSSQTVTHGHNRVADNQQGSTHIRASATLNAITSGFFQIRVTFTVHGITVSQKALNISSVGNFSVSLTHRGREQGAPSYLEKLDSTDQFTKSQYIPR